MQTDNTNAHGMVTNNISGKRLKSMDMIIHWLWCRATQGQFQHYYRARSTNKGDYVTNHHADIHHWRVQPTYLTLKIQLNLLRKRTIIKEAELRNKPQHGCARLVSFYWDFIGTMELLLHSYYGVIERVQTCHQYMNTIIHMTTKTGRHAVK